MDQPSTTLDRAIRLLDCFSKDEPYLGVREAAKKADLSSSTTGRIFSSLKQLGLLFQDPETQKYALAGKVLAWAEIYSATLDMRRLARPFIEELQQITDETISLYVQEGVNRICVDRLESDQNVRVVARIGRNIPLYAGSAGKLFLAYLPDQERENIFSHTDIEPLTPYTIIDLEELRHQAVLIREQGYSISHREWTVDASGVSAPIFNQRAQMIAALTVSGPTERFTQDNMDRCAAACKHTAAQISRLLGYQPRQRNIGNHPEQ
jgi:DNA-binding IclR family transcriptional regulator